MLSMNTKASECKGPEICVRKVMQELETSKRIIDNNGIENINCEIVIYLYHYDNRKK